MKTTIAFRLFSAGAAGVFAFLSGAAAIQAQEYVIRDRVAEARERILGQQYQGMENQLVVPVPTRPAQVMQTVPVTQEISQARIHASPAMYATTAPVPQYEDGYPQMYQRDEYTSSVLRYSENDPYHAPRYVQDQAAGHDFVQVQAPIGQSRQSGSWSSRLTPGVVWSNTHYFEGQRGSVAPLAPISYHSVYSRSGFGADTDAAGNPMFCDEWCEMCGCPPCNEPIGLRCFRPQHHHKKMCGECGECGDTGCKGKLFHGKKDSCGCGCGN